uniref:C-type lectin domain-containing protein n=1 Tax=Sander lucioperca TaxID=283035 RepID=A0A8C9YTA1_SANLU
MRNKIIIMPLSDLNYDNSTAHYRVCFSVSSCSKSQKGWEYFSGSFYYISSTKKTWQQSRDDCRQKGADLVIINSKEEQDFTRNFQKRLWIGLTDSETEGTWKWVDGTPLTKSYWDSGEPNDENGEDCVEIRFYNSENSWNDVGCSTRLNWICERKDRP